MVLSFGETLAAWSTSCFKVKTIVFDYELNVLSVFNFKANRCIEVFFPINPSCGKVAPKGNGYLAHIHDRNADVA